MPEEKIEEPQLNIESEVKTKKSKLIPILGGVVVVTALIVGVYGWQKQLGPFAPAPTPTPTLTPMSGSPKTGEEIRDELIAGGVSIFLTDELDKLYHGYSASSKTLYFLQYDIFQKDKYSMLNAGKKYKEVLTQNGWRIGSEKSNDCSGRTDACFNWLYLQAFKGTTIVVLDTHSVLGFGIEIQLSEEAANRVLVPEGIQDNVIKNLNVQKVFNLQIDQELRRQIIFVEGDLPQASDHVEMICNYLGLEITRAGYGSSPGSYDYGCIADDNTFLKVIIHSSDYFPEQSTIIDYQYKE